MGYVYLITNGDAYKIGIAVNLQTRITSIQTGNNKKIRLVHSVASKFPGVLESKLHQEYKQFRILGEWFDFATVDIHSIIETIDRFAIECESYVPPKRKSTIPGEPTEGMIAKRIAAEQRRAKYIPVIESVINASETPGCYLLSNVAAPKIMGDGWAETDLFSGYDYVIVPVARVEGRRHGLGWVKF